MCTRCGRPACGDCLVQAAVGSHCLDCTKASRPDVVTRTRLATSGFHAPVTGALIAINVLVFVWMGAFGSRITEKHVDLGLDRLFLSGVALDDTVYQGEWYRLVSAGFIHFGVVHLLMNMLLLYQLGNLLERAVGSVRFALLYFGSLLAGSFGVLLLDNPNTLTITGGASGAVYGLMAGAAVGLHRRGANVFNTGIGTTLLLNLVFTFTIPGISIGGHLGGAVGGAICGWVMLTPPWKPVPRWATWMTPVGVAAAALIGSVLVVG